MLKWLNNSKPEPGEICKTVDDNVSTTKDGEKDIKAHKGRKEAAGPPLFKLFNPFRTLSQQTIQACSSTPTGKTTASTAIWTQPPPQDQELGSNPTSTSGEIGGGKTETETKGITGAEDTNGANPIPLDNSLAWWAIEPAITNTIPLIINEMPQRDVGIHKMSIALCCPKRMPEYRCLLVEMYLQLSNANTNILTCEAGATGHPVEDFPRETSGSPPNPNRERNNGLQTTLNPAQPKRNLQNKNTAANGGGSQGRRQLHNRRRPVANLRSNLPPHRPSPSPLIRPRGYP
ncbi:hypothetical protein PCASD_08319 [Puccinia coronata f. sp. avenae]|uniref:Uncharacterized protein n=1 Tax=Puccinia coronata f. sp. avenae TaxID=200324 RepID=A0A2N5USL4_9BASI|nr:hypothetical protein PCASD_08319 [Puccinia coronata f. sp. avenae]